MNFQDLKLKVNSDYNIAKLPTGEEIQVKKYLPVSDKIDLIDIALQKSEQNGIFNEIALDMHFELNIIYLYTDLLFTPEDREDEFELYDKLNNNNIIVSVIGAMEEGEYETLLTYCREMKDNILKYRNSAAAVMRGFIQDLPTKMREAAEVLNEFDPEKYPELMNFVTATNGGRSIFTNTKIPVNQETAPVSTAAPNLKVSSAKKDN